MTTQGAGSEASEHSLEAAPSGTTSDDAAVSTMQTETSASLAEALLAAHAAKRAATIAAWASVAAAAITLGGTFLTNDTNRDLAEDARRGEVYGEFFEQVALNNEFIWSHSSWAGEIDANTGQPVEPSDDSPFWRDASAFQATLKSTYIAAYLASSTPEVRTGLTELQDDQVNTWRTFKCMATLEQCEDIPRGTNDEILGMLHAWDADREDDITHLTALMLDE